MSYSIPILFIIFKRPTVSITAFKKIQKVKPTKLYIASDGWRENVANEKKLVEETRNLILSQINWNCEIKLKFENSNLGCAHGVYSAINWLFQNEEMGIILEDDCVVV